MCRHAVLFQSWQTSFRNVWNAHNSLCKWWCEKEESFKMVLEVPRGKWIGGGRRSHRTLTSGSKKNVARVQANWDLTILETTIIWLSLDNPDQRFEQITLYLSVLMGKTIPTLLQTAYPPDLSPCDFWVFLKFKEMNGKRWHNWRHNLQQDTLYAHDSKSRLPEMFPAVTGVLEQVYAGMREGILKDGNNKIGIQSLNSLIKPFSWSGQVVHL